jgi:hypothetical protein
VNAVPQFELRQSSQLLTSRAGLVLVGRALERFAGLTRAIDPRFPVRTGIPTSDLLKSYVGLLCESKSDFDAIESKRADRAFALALKLRQVPSSPTLRQRLDDLGVAGATAVDALTVPLLQRGKAPITALDTGHVALDLDVFTLDNSGTRKEGVARTYQGYDGYAPIAAYLGQEGWCVGLELRAGDRHSAHETQYTFERVIPAAAALTQRPLLLRMDSGFDSEKLYTQALDCAAEAGAKLDLLGKWNPRSTPVEAIAHAKCADRATAWTALRPGKRETVWVEAGRTLTLADGTRRTLRRVLRLTERRTDRDGQAYLFPKFELDGWETTLELAPEQIIALYADHGTHEQFHSEFKSDLDLERLPSGKFDTNYLVLSLAALAYNVLRLIGQHTLLGDDAPLRHPAKRRRLKTVIQELITVAARVLTHARRIVLDFGAHCPAFTAFNRTWMAWQEAPS